MPPTSSSALPGRFAFPTLAELTAAVSDHPVFIMEGRGSRPLLI